VLGRSYGMQMRDGNQMAADDPFAGRGIFLPLDAQAEVQLRALENAFGVIPATAWPGRGVWIDSAVLSITKDEALALWEASWAMGKPDEAAQG
jgi:hypothetical protein